MKNINAIKTNNADPIAFVVVNSRSYGKHMRAKRGTYTPITLNAGMVASSKAQNTANKQAKVVFDAVVAFANHFKNGMLWRRLLSICRQALKDQDRHFFQYLNRMDIREDYPISRKLNIQQFYYDAECLNFDISFYAKQFLPCRISVLRIATDANFDKSILSASTAVDVQDARAKLSFELEALMEDYISIYLLKYEQLDSGVPSGLLKDSGICFLS
jgi:hypothetical protein